MPRPIFEEVPYLEVSNGNFDDTNFQQCWVKYCENTISIQLVKRLLSYTVGNVENIQLGRNEFSYSHLKGRGAIIKEVQYFFWCLV